jgi:hypothetical protein
MSIDSFEKIKTVKVKRECGECNICCKGWLKGEAYGHKFYPSQPCFFLGKNCTIHEIRPDVCKKFNCEWLKNDNFPEWMKPNISNVIIAPRVQNNILYYIAIETGKKIDIIVLNWLIQEILKRGLNLYYYIEGVGYKIGSQDFIDLKIEE